MNKRKGSVDPPEVAAIKIAKWREAGLIPPPKQSKESMNKKEGKPSIVPKPTDTQPKPARKRIESGIGDCLKKYFDSIGAKQTPGCPCKDIQAKLNKRSPEQVTKEIDSWVGDILENVKNLSGVTGLVANAAKYIAPKMLREKLKSEILRCLEESKVNLSQTAQYAPKNDPDQKTTT